MILQSMVMRAVLPQRRAVGAEGHTQGLRGICRGLTELSQSSSEHGNHVQEADGVATAEKTKFGPCSRATLIDTHAVASRKIEKTGIVESKDRWRHMQRDCQSESNTLQPVFSGVTG